MKQGLRFFVKPGTFFNQLQWSSHHWIIMLAFLVIATVETHIGRQHFYYQVFADTLADSLGVSWSVALWIVTSVKMVVMVLGTFGLASLIWVIGNLFGRRTSKRVLFRRLAVVFTVLLAGYTMNHLADTYPAAAIATLVLYLWAVVLGYFAIREQFALNHLEGVVMGLFALLLVTSVWHYSNHFMEAAARKQAVEVSKQPRPDAKRSRF